MAFRTTLSNLNLKRTLASLYMSAASPQAFTFDPNYAGVDIYPGMVMAVHGDGIVTLCSGAATVEPLGLAAHFVAPTIGVDEVTTDPTRMIGVYVGGPDAQYSILAPAFDTTKTWAVPTDGTEVLLVAGSGALNEGKLCPKPAADDATVGYEVLAAAKPIARLVSVPSATEIIVAPVR